LAINHIHTYLVHPGKGSQAARHVGGAAVALSGKLFDLLSDVYARSENECDIDIAFRPDANGTQRNPCRDLLVTYLGGPTLDRGEQIAEKLEAVTTNRSGLGLLFLIVGSEGLDHKVVISRFPAHSAISAEEDQQTLSVEFLERVFMKSAHAYKAVLYRDTSLTSGFWLGRAVDKQINSPETRASNYWIAEFLDSDSRVTPAAGTRRLAVALRDAARRSSNVGVKSEIAAAVTLATGLKGQTLSISEFGQRQGLSVAAKQAVSGELKSTSIADEKFQFDLDEFTKHVAYRTVELDSGALLVAAAPAFDKVFQREVIDESEHRVRFSTEGKVISEKLGKSR
jgi:hypothetical protein